jgi:hypothetical protein
MAELEGASGSATVVTALGVYLGGRGSGAGSESGSEFKKRHSQDQDPPSFLPHSPPPPKMPSRPSSHSLRVYERILPSAERLP